MGIGNVNDDELQCIQKSNHEFGIFKFNTFDEVMRVFRDVLTIMESPIAPNTCLDNGGLLRKKKK